MSSARFGYKPPCKRVFTPGAGAYERPFLMGKAYVNGKNSFSFGVSRKSMNKIFVDKIKKTGDRDMPGAGAYGTFSDFDGLTPSLQTKKE